MEQKENAIIIDGIKHVLVDVAENEPCTTCSLWNICGNVSNKENICYNVFCTEDKHFEIKE